MRPHPGAAATDSPRGWQSPYYNHRQPVLSLEVVSEGQSILFCSSLGANISEVKVDETKLMLLVDRWETEVRLQHDRKNTLVSKIVCMGTLKDKLSPSC